MLWDERQPGVPDSGWPPACGAGEENPSDKGFCQIKVEMTWHHLVL